MTEGTTNILKIAIKNSYGQTRYYPVCNNAKVFATLTGTKTLTKDNLELIEGKLGYTIQYLDHNKLKLTLAW